MDRKGFTLIELLACLALLGVILGIGLYVTRGTLSTALSTLTDVSESQLYDATRIYILENKVTWVNVDEKEYTCVTVTDLVDTGHFNEEEVISYKDDMIEVTREPKTKVVNKVKLVDECSY